MVSCLPEPVLLDLAAFIVKEQANALRHANHVLESGAILTSQLSDVAIDAMSVLSVWN